jgi:hypothetical protein
LEKHITVVSNDPVTPQVHLSLKGTVTVVFDAPVQVLYGDLLVGQSTNFVVTMKRQDGKSLKLTKVESSDPNITVTPDPNQPTNTVANVNVTVKATAAPRQLYGTITYLAEGQAQPVARTTVFGQVVPELRLLPEKIIWGIPDLKNWPGTFNSDQMRTRTLRMERKKLGSPFTIRSIKTEIPGMTVSYNTDETGRVYTVVAKLAKAPEKNVEGTIVVETDWAEYSVVNIPVSITILNRVPARIPRPVPHR